MATPKATLRATNGEEQWQQVRRRRPFPPNWRHSDPPQPRTTLYQPYSRPTYAQILKQPSPPKPTLISAQPTPSSPPSTPTLPNTTVYYVSPHSPSRLRFPPSHTFSEWKGRCFCCCRTGHTAAKCRNPKRCGRCWAFGHIGSKCKQDVVAPPLPTWHLPQPSNARLGEPGFDELLTASYPYLGPEMPKERPLRTHCFIERDADYFKELERLKQSVVMYTGGFQWELSVDNVADYACHTKLVKREEIQVSALSGSRFLIVLPEGLDPDTFINATPQQAWDDGLSFQPWTPLDNAEISVPAYKVLLQLVGIPPHLWRDKHIANAVSKFGVYLGSVAPENPASIASWTVAVGVDDLTLVPPQLAMHDGGLIHPIQVHTLAWHRGPIYSADEMPKHPKKYLRPQPLPLSSSSSDDGTCYDTELIPMSSRVLRDVCRGRTADSLPPELRQFATLEEINMQHPCIATQDLAAEEFATIDQQVQNQNVPLNAQTESKRSPAIQRIDRRMEDVVGSSSRLSDTIHENSNNSVRRGSGDRVFPKDPNNCLGQQLISDTNLQHLPKVSHISTGANLPHIEAKKAQPRRILSRGDNLGKQMPPVRINSVQEGAAFNQRRILSTNTTITPANITPETAANSKDPSLLISETIRKERVRKGIPSGFVFQAKGKGPATEIRPGPYASKYKWTRPSKTVPANSAQITKKAIATAGLKRKNPQAHSLGSVKKAAIKGKPKNSADVSFNSEGFYEVRVDYGHVENLAAGCGLKTSDVEGIIHADNAERQNLAQSNASCSRIVTDEEEADLARFELNSDDELSSDEEAC